MKMKKFLIFLLCGICTLCLFASCGKAETSKKKIIFRQEGGQDIVFEIEKGKAFEDEMPALIEKKGYDVVWSKEKQDLTNITEETIVTAVYTPKTYRIFFSGVDKTKLEASAESLGITLKAYGNVLFQEVRFDAAYAVPEPADEFYGWVLDGAAFNPEKTYTYDRNITLTLQEVVSVTFRQDGQEDVTYRVKKGQDYDSPLPALSEKTGYTPSWDISSDALTALQKDVIVNAIYTPNEYKIYFDGVTAEQLRASAEKLGVVIEEENGKVFMKATYGAAFRLPSPNLSSFSNWKIGERAFAEGVYMQAGDVTLTAHFDKNNDDNWSPSGW